MATIYEELGVDTFINAAGTYTAIGGSRMSKATSKAMNEASEHHVEIRKLQKVVHSKLAELTNNEDAFVSNGAAAGLYICTGAALAKKYGKKAYYLTKEEINDAEIIIFAAHRNPYGQVVSQYGVTVKEIGYPNIILPLTELDLEMAINSKTAAIFFFVGDDGGWVAKGGLNFKSTAKIANKHNVPLIVDCAAQIPPVTNLWEYTSNGADVAVFSGGKDIKGPQAAGLVLGKSSFLQHVHETGFPNYGYGRMLKTGREEIVGMYHAVKELVELDHDARNKWAERQIELLTSALEDTKNFSVTRTYPNEAAQPMPRASVVFPENVSADEILELLMKGENKIMCNSEEPNQVFVNPMTLKEGEIQLVIKKFKYIDKTLTENKK